MKREREKELIEILRSILHGFPPYENAGRYKILEEVRALEVNLERDHQDEKPAEGKS